MKFGALPVAEAKGAMLAHAIRLVDGMLHKGHRLEDADIDRLRHAGIAMVIAASIGTDDVPENEAAERLAQAVAPDHLRLSEAATGRVNLHSTVDGLFVADRATVDRLNRIDPAITLACLADHVPVRDGDMVATFKIIPLAVPAGKIAEACHLLRELTAFAVKPFIPHAISLVATELPSLKPAVMDKTAAILERRLLPSRSRLVRERRVAHQADAIAAAITRCIDLADKEPKLIIVFGASAVIDAADVIPQAIRDAGGTVIRVGMPVDPGNLLVLGRIGDIPVIGAPGCARSPRENGFDWVLDRILAGENPDAEDITGMGVGGLLMEIQSRPQPRDIGAKPQSEISVGIVLLAAGKASRMGAGGPHKLLAEFDGVPLVRRSAISARTSKATSVTVVTGYRHDDIEAMLTGLDLETAYNPHYESGMASSLITGLSAMGQQRAHGILVMLADMPGVTTSDIDALIAAFQSAGGQSIVRAVSHGRRGNPVILPRTLYDAILRLEGDIGAKHIIETSGLPILDVDIGDGAHLDVDTPDAVKAAGGVLRG